MSTLTLDRFLHSTAGEKCFPAADPLEPNTLCTVGLSAGLQQIPGESQRLGSITGNNL